jgi:hypothetical protein
VFEISMHQPAGAIGARDFFGRFEQLDAGAAEPALWLGETDREQVGVEHGGRSLVRQPPEALRRQRLLVDQAADRFCAIERPCADHGHRIVHG